MVPAALECEPPAIIARIEFSTTANATLLTVVGDLAPDEIKTIIADHYARFEKPNVVWDLTDGTLLRLNIAEFRQVAETARKTMQRPLRRVAFVGGSQETFALLCMYSAIATLHDVPVEYSAFRRLDEALKWIG